MVGNREHNISGNSGMNDVYERKYFEPTDHFYINWDARMGGYDPYTLAALEELSSRDVHVTYVDERVAA